MYHKCSQYPTHTHIIYIYTVYYSYIYISHVPIISPWKSNIWTHNQWLKTRQHLVENALKSHWDHEDTIYTSHIPHYIWKFSQSNHVKSMWLNWNPMKTPKNPMKTHENPQNSHENPLKKIVPSRHASRPSPAAWAPIRGAGHLGARGNVMGPWKAMVGRGCGNWKNTGYFWMGRQNKPQRSRKFIRFFHDRCWTWWGWTQWHLMKIGTSSMRIDGKPHQS